MASTLDKFLSCFIDMSVYKGGPIMKIVPLTALRNAPGNVSLAVRAYAEIRNRILRGDIPLGGVLSRRQIANDLKMSLLPVSEALQCLENEGLVESKARGGTRVRIPSEQDVSDHYVLREALEAQSARLFVELATSTEKKEVQQTARHLDQLFAACEESGPSRDFLFSVHTFHMNFHLQIAEGSKCPALVRAIEKEQILIFNWLYDTVTERRRLPKHFHSKLASALARGKVEVADTEMRRHVRFGSMQVLAKVEGITQTELGWRLSPNNRKAA